ncbi:MAG: 2-oxo acid dehydrogenase subunit E2 [Candidatus Heimdallarchaeota archaeon]|nr:2-oxo acid dehydrogenase subunit E2 [Candidatus Heimdallarchaeota archaeon]
MPKEKNYHIRKFSPTRRILADYNDVAASLNRVQGLIEIDITKALVKIEEIEKKENYKVSMTGWVAKCVSQVAIENKHLNSFRKGGRKLVVFDDVDISIIIEITTKSGKKVPYNYVIRKVDTKSVKTITEEIRTTQDRKINEKEQLTRGTSTYMALYSLLPRFFRRFVIRKIITNPFRLRKLIGTIGITSLGMFIKGQGGWAVPFSDKTFNIALGGIKENAVIRNGKLEERKILCTTFLFDHNIVDGAPAARLVSRLTELMGDTQYLDDLEKI